MSDNSNETDRLLASSAPVDSSAERGETTDGMAPNQHISGAEYLKDSLLLKRTGMLAQVGLAVSLITLWVVLYKHPAGLFSYHPALQSVAILGFTEGVLLLQPQPRDQAHKKKGFQLHQAFQYTALPIILAGAAVIIYNKAAHGAKHFQTWHAKFGVATLALIATQITFGAIMVYVPLTSILGGQAKAKQWWKYHRMSGYLTLAGLFATPLLALDSDWLKNNSNSVERLLIGGGLVAAAVGVVARISTAKLGFKQR